MYDCWLNNALQLHSELDAESVLWTFNFPARAAVRPFQKYGPRAGAAWLWAGEGGGGDVVNLSANSQALKLLVISGANMAMLIFAVERRRTHEAWPKGERERETEESEYEGGLTLLFLMHPRGPINRRLLGSWA